MNGRVYDPVVARFTSADPMTENPFSTQGWNRYSYVGNSPLNFTDPSGYCFAGCFWKPVLSGIQKALVRSPILRVVLQVVATAMCGGNIVCGMLVGAAVSAAITGITGGNLSQSLRAGLIAATSAIAFYAVGTATLGDAHATASFGSDQYLANVAGHAAVGCGMAIASGGKCGPGAAGAAAGAAGAPLIGKNLVIGTAASAVIGGLASVAAGGKFATGAETAAFGYLFNEMGQYIKAGASLGQMAYYYGDKTGYVAYPDGDFIPDSSGQPMAKPHNVSIGGIIEDQIDRGVSIFNLKDDFKAYGRLDFQRTTPNSFNKDFTDFTNYVFGVVAAEHNISAFGADMIAAGYNLGWGKYRGGFLGLPVDNLRMINQGSRDYIGGRW